MSMSRIPAESIAMIRLTNSQAGAFALGAAGAPGASGDRALRPAEGWHESESGARYYVTHVGDATYNLLFRVSGLGT